MKTVSNPLFGASAAVLIAFAGSANGFASTLHDASSSRFSTSMDASSRTEDFEKNSLDFFQIAKASTVAIALASTFCMAQPALADAPEGGATTAANAKVSWNKFHVFAKEFEKSPASIKQMMNEIRLPCVLIPPF